MIAVYECRLSQCVYMGCTNGEISQRFFAFSLYNQRSVVRYGLKSVIGTDGQ